VSGITEGLQVAESTGINRIGYMGDMRKDKDKRQEMGH